jgi:hypothetical protein
MSDKDQTTAKLDRVVGRALRDDQFREKLTANPNATLKGEGLTDEDLEAVSGGALNAYAQAASLNFHKVVLPAVQNGLLLPAVHYKEQKVKVGDGSV